MRQSSPNIVRRNIAIRIDGKLMLARVTLIGRVTEQRVVAALALLRSHPRYRPGMPRLWNVRHADLSGLTGTEFRRLTAWSSLATARA